MLLRVALFWCWALVMGDQQSGQAQANHDFLVMGDWGGMPIWPYVSPAEHGVAKSMGKLAGVVNASYALALGDNFYTKGVTSVEDKRFSETFEQVFTSTALTGTNFFRVLAGNHDHYGNVSAQIAYSSRSARWHFPSLYYSFVEPVGASNQTVQIVMIDTVTLSGDSINPSTGEGLAGSQYPGPASESAADAQWEWLNKTLMASTADYLLAAGHFPVWSICEHGPTANLVQKLKPLLEQHRVSAYLAGHDHCAQHIDEGKGVQYHGIGAGILCDASTAHKGAIPAGSLKWHYDAGILGVLSGAFGHISVNADGMVVTHYDSAGKKLYQAPPIPPRGTPAVTSL